MIVKIV